MDRDSVRRRYKVRLMIPEAPHNLLCRRLTTSRTLVNLTSKLTTYEIASDQFRCFGWTKLLTKSRSMKVIGSGERSTPYFGTRRSGHESRVHQHCGFRDSQCAERQANWSRQPRRNFSVPGRTDLSERTVRRPGWRHPPCYHRATTADE